ncbi:MAG: signal peptidase II [Proteobacteria bacterium]|nr:signal peptidase II [Pseudomonadota bacterium]
MENGSGSGPMGLTFSPLFRKGLAVAVAVLAADQITKWWLLSAVMQPPRVIPVTPFFNLVLGWNRGVSFGILNSESLISAWLLPLAVIAIIVALGVWLTRADRPRVAVALGLIIGGAIGNLVDRLRFGAVTDFLDFYAAGFHWPAFNLADSGITVGAIVLILDSLFVREEKP